MTAASWEFIRLRRNITSKPPGTIEWEWGRGDG